MTKREWLEDRVDALEKSLKEYICDDGDNFEHNAELVMCSPMDCIQLSQGIVALAEELGAEITYEYFGGKFPHKYSFMYRGHEVLQLSKDKLEV